MWFRDELKSLAKSCVRANYWPLVLISLFFLVLSGEAFSNGPWFNVDLSNAAVSLTFNDMTIWSSAELPFLSHFSFLTTVLSLILLLIVLGAFLLSIFVLAPLNVGCRRYFLIAMDERPSFGCLLQNFDQGYWNTVETMFLRSLFTVLWSLLLFVPGIVKGYEYRLIPYLLAEYPDMPRSEVFRVSRDLMYGNKLDAFVLDLSFIGWSLLSTVTLGLVGIFYVNPYQNMTNAQLYRAICRGARAGGPTV